MFGIVGDKELVLKESGVYSKGKPTLEIVGFDATEKIIYTIDWNDYFKP